MKLRAVVVANVTNHERGTSEYLFRQNLTSCEKFSVKGEKFRGDSR